MSAINSIHFLKNKTILIISPQSWGKMFVSKHHYATELAKCGNTVYFLNPPDPSLEDRINISEEKNFPGLYIISHRIFFPYDIKFHAIPIFHWLMKWQVKKIIKKMGAVPDIIWSFDLGNLYPFRLFTFNSLKIFHPVDEPLNSTAIDSAKNAQVIFSVTPEILDKYKHYKIPSFVINHGISNTFLGESGTIKKDNNNIQIGFSANMIREDIDRETLLKIVRENPDHNFNFWGNYDSKNTNLGESGSNAEGFINELKNEKNVILNGAVSTIELAQSFRAMDAFLICYDINKDQSKGTNYHKVLEYISTGRVVISNNITTYKYKPSLVQMVEERDHNKMLPELFKKITHELPLYNSLLLEQERKTFAANNTYLKQIERIDSILINKIIIN